MRKWATVRSLADETLLQVGRAYLGAEHIAGPLFSSQLNLASDYVSRESVDSEKHKKRLRSRLEPKKAR